MKILQLAPERTAASRTARVVHGIAQDVTLTWAQTPASALEWLHGNPDAAAVIVQLHAQSCGPFVGRLRKLGLTTPVVVVAGSERLEPALDALNSGVDGYVVSGKTLEDELPRTIAAAVERERSRRHVLGQAAGAGMGGAQNRRHSDQVHATPALRAGSIQPVAAPQVTGSEHAIALARETRICLALQERLFEIEAALEAAESRRTSDARSFAGQLARQHDDFTARLAEVCDIRDTLAATLAETAAALDEVRRARAADAAMAAAQVRGADAELRRDLAEVAAGRTALERALEEAEAAHRATRERAEMNLAAAQARQAALEHLLTHEAARRALLEDRLAQAMERASIDLATAANRQAALEDLLAQEAARAAESQAAEATRYAALEERLSQEATRASIDLSAAAVRQAALEEQLAQETRRSAIELTAATARQVALEDQLAHETARHAALEDQFVGDVERAADDLAAAASRQAALEDRLAWEMQLASEDLVDAVARQQVLEARLSQESERAARLERQLSAAETAGQEATRQHASDIAAAALQFDALQARHDAAIADHAAASGILEQRLAEAVTAQQEAERRIAGLIASASARETELLAAASARESELLAAAAARETELLAAASAREAELVARLSAEGAARAAVERDLAAAHLESARGRQRSRHVVSAHRRRSRERVAELEALLAAERIDVHRELRTKDEDIRHIQLEREALHGLLGDAQHDLQDLRVTLHKERQAHERARVTSESDLDRISADYSALRASFDRLQTAFDGLEQLTAGQSAECARLESLVSDRDSQLSAESTRHHAAERAAQDALAQLQETLRHAVDTSGAEMARLRQEIDGLRRELGATRTHAHAIRGVAESVPDLQAQLERSRNESRRQFERAPYALCRCSADGAITDANHSFLMLLGYRRVHDVRNMDLVATAFDKAGDLSWLIERARSTRKTESVETEWKTRDGRRLVIRLQAFATAAGSIEIVAEDVTGVRVLEERLRHAERMEAVGRLAAEVAVTCEGLLTDVARGAQDWLAHIGGDEAPRRHAENLLTDVTRAAGFLRQLGRYGDEQVRALEPVSARRVLRDLAPVLKRLIGDDIELVLPKSAGPFHVDVDASRLERVLINVAGYARERIPSGGQVRIDLATTAVGRKFVARYSNVRPGDHVLITVTEVPAAGGRRATADLGLRSADKPGVDLGVLVELIASCGGHLWLEAQPAGNMVVKIHLPKARLADASDTRGSRLTRWFRSTAAARVGA